MRFFNNKNKYGQVSYSQSGEDVIISFIFNAIGITKPSYLDIGAHHPFYLNNTALFYETGSTGINVEPDPSLIKEFIKYRKKDININVGISNRNSKLDLYIMNIPTLNTFSEEEAHRYEGLDIKIKEVREIDVISIYTLLDKYCNKKFPELLTIDTEGVDEIILKNIDYSKNSPIVICVETISFSTEGNGVKNVSLIEFIKSNGYLLYADTYINSIFVRENVWKKN